jgi:hypothetical protein
MGKWLSMSDPHSPEALSVMEIRTIHRACLLLVFVTLTFSGCRSSDFPALYPVTGIVQMEDGKPLKHGVVEFEATNDSKLRGSARVEFDGSLVDVCTYLPNGKESPGLAEGTHRVMITRSIALSDRDGPPMTIPAKYASFDSSNLSVTISPLPNTVTLQLKTKSNGH